MSKRSADTPPNPVPWDGAGLGLDAATLGGSPREAVLRAFPDVTPFELKCALTLSPYLGSFLRAEDAVSRVSALREARPGRPDLSEADWEQVVDVLYDRLNEEQRQKPAELLAAIAALRPAPRKGSGNGVTVRRIVEALISWSGEWPPSQDAFAIAALRVTDRRVRQVLDDAGTTWGAVVEEAGALR